MTSAKFREEFDKYDPIDVEGVVIEHKKWIAERMRRHRSTMWINLASLCLSLLLIISTFIPLRNLLSTMYPGNGLGYFSLCCIYASYVIGCYALSAIAHYIHPKGAIVLAIIGHSIFAGSHLYPSFETLIPASCILGLCQAVLWRSQELLCTSYAANFAALSGINVNDVLKRFHIALIFSVQLAQIMGNSLVSFIFFQHHTLNKAHFSDTINSTSDEGPMIGSSNHAVRDISYIPSEPLSGQHFHTPFAYDHPFAAMNVDYCPKQPLSIVNTFAGDFHTVKIVFLSFTIAALVMVSVFLHKPDILVQKRNLEFKYQLHEIFHVWLEKRWLLTTGVVFYSGIQQALIVGELTKITSLCSLGVPYLGFLMVTFGLCSFLADTISSRIQKFGGRILTGIAGFMVSGGLLSLTLLWRPDEAGAILVFAFIGGWGIVDGIWQSQITALVKTQFIEYGEAVKVNAHVLQALGSAIAFGYAPFVSFSTKAYVSLAFVAWAIMGYIVWESTTVTFQIRSMSSSV
ncbi:protein unc-93 homolog A-like [Argonauta hians]